jgi:hypothetical protein
MAAETLRLASLSVLGGSLHGRRLDLEEVVSEVLIGSDPDCHLALDLPTISPIHAKLWTELNGATVYDTHAPRGLYVNLDRVVGQTHLGEGDVLWLGPPREPGSVCVQCHFEPWVEVLPASPVAEETPVAAAVPIDAYEAVVLEEDGSTSVAVAGPPLEPAPPIEPSPPSPITPAEPGGQDAFFVSWGGPSPQAPAPSSEPAVEAEADAFFIEEARSRRDEAAATGPAEAPSFGKPAPATPTRGPAEETGGVAEPAAPGRPPAAPAGEAQADDFFVAEPEPPGAPVREVVFEAESVPRVSPKPLIDLPPLAPAPKPAAAATPAAAAIPAAPAPPSRAPAPTPPASPTPPRAEAGPAAGGPPSAPRAVPATAHPEAAATADAAAPPAARRPVAGQVVSRTAATPRRPAPAAGRPTTRRPTRRGSPSLLRSAVIGLAAIGVLAGLAFGVWLILAGGVRLDEVTPARLRVGQTATLTGRGFASSPAGNTVLFDDKVAKVLEATSTRLVVEVPEAVAEAGGERRVSLVVRKGSRGSRPIDVVVFQGPRLHGLSPEAAMPGEEVLLAGAGWGVGATVRFGDLPAQTLDVQATQIRVTVPAIAGGPGTAAPVVVTVGGVESNPVPFFVGHLPLVTSVQPPGAAPGEVVVVSGRGFQRDPLRNDVRVGGVPALVLSGTDDELSLVVPRMGPGEPSRALEVRVPGSATVGQAVLQVPAPGETVDFRFVAEPFTAVPGSPCAVLASDLGPAFVLAAAGGHSAAQRALEAQHRLNQAAVALKATRGLNLEARGLESNPVIGLAGRPEVLLEVAAEDAAAYAEDWTGLRGRGGPVTRLRLARWWEAVGRDLVLLTLRGEAPQYAAALAPEGRVLAQVFEAARRTGRFGVPQSVVAEMRPALRDGLQLLALRVPASVTAPVAAVAPTAPPGPGPAGAPPTPAAERLRLEGAWAGSETEEGQQRYLTVTFGRGGGGTVAYEGGITFTMPLMGVEQPRRDQVQFSVQIRGGVRYYQGRWDGEAIRGNITRDPAGKNVVATFVLRPR